MTHGFNELPVYPELQTWTLYNQFDKSERIVTEAMLETAFPDEVERMRILTGRHPAWFITENVYDPHASTILY